MIHIINIYVKEVKTKLELRELRMIKNMYNLILDAEKNPLWKLPIAQRFQIMMILSFMWSVIFSVGIGTWSLFGYSVLLHVIIVAGIFFTSWTFAEVQNKSPRDLIQRTDSTPKYDDIWGA